MQKFGMLLDKATVKLHKIFQTVFVIFFGLILLNVIFNREVYNYIALILILLAAAVLYMLYCANCRLINADDYINKNYKLIMVVAASLMFLIQMVFVEALRFEPIFDLEAVYSSAIHWVQNGSFADYVSSTCHTDYFYIFPNNLGCLYYYFAIFKLSSLVGITDYFLVAAICNSLLICGSLLLSAGIARRLWSEKAAVICACFFFISPPFWFMADVFYTDSLTMTFPVAVWYCVLCADECKKRVSVALWYLLAGVMCLIGWLIKPTVLIVFVAIAIVQLLRNQWIKQAALTVIAVVVLICGNLAFDALVYPSQLDPVKAEQVNLPYEYWLSIGLSGDGRYRNDYFSASMAPVGQNAKKEAMRPIIKNDLKQQGVFGLIELFTSKTARAFGDGTYASSDFLDDRPQSPNVLHKFLLYDSEGYSVYSHICTAVLLALLAMSLYGVFKQGTDMRATVAPLCLFGLMLFLMIWEVNGRYILNFVPMIFISATGGCLSLPNKSK